jgi:flagellar protein FliS
MNASNQYKQYQSQAINTLTPGELLIILYDQLILCINKAVLNIKNKKINETHNNIIKAQNIILYLIDILDMSFPISKELLQLYEYIYKQLISANVAKDEKILKEILPLISELKNTWQQADIAARKKNISKG